MAATALRWELMLPPPHRLLSARHIQLAPARAAAFTRQSCGSCGAMLILPLGLARCGCRICAVELAVDLARLRLSTPNAYSAEAEGDEAVRRRIGSNGSQQAAVPRGSAGEAPAGGSFGSWKQLRPAGVAVESPPGLIGLHPCLEDSTVG